MTEKKVEINASILDGVHNSFMELAQHCAQLGVRIDSVSFNWFSPMSLHGTEKEVLLSVNINSSKIKDR